MTETQASQINITLGTAGHIDHGKTALIKLLTGCETDRLRQEKERGMSIELGFAPCRLGNLEVGIVDVPGHENFIKTMVAGATGIDGVIFVVAADDGIMPQTREHLDILTLLGVQHGMVAMTKTDIVSAEQVETVKAQLKQFLCGTFLENTPICPMSAITGAGFDGFYTALKEMIASISPRNTEGVFRMPVERMFSVKGFGTVVSGIPAGGSAKTGDEVILLPAGNKSRIKAIQVYGQDANLVKSGQCAALNLPQANYKSVHRGDVLTEDGYFKPAMWFACKLRMLALKGQGLKNGSKVKFHTGTSEVSGTVYSLETESVTAGQEALIQVRTERAIVAGPNDPYILRAVSPSRTLGGGRVIEPMERKIKRSHLEAVEAVKELASSVAEPAAFVEYCIRHAVGYAAKCSGVSVRTKLPPGQVAEVIETLVKQGSVLPLTGDVYMHRESLEQVTQTLKRQVEQFHQQKPDSPGIDKEQLFAQSELDKKVFDAVAALLLERKELTVRKDRFALSSHNEQFDPAVQKQLDSAEALFAQKLFRPPKIEEIASVLHQDAQAVNKTIELLLEQQLIVQVERGLYFHADAIKEAKRRATEYIQADGQGRLESVQFKYLLDTTRKFAIPLLDYLDKIGVTRRVGNTRYLK